MKKLLLVFAFMLSLISVVFAKVAVYDDGTYSGEAVKINFTGSDVSFSQDTATVAVTNVDTGAYKYAMMPISAIEASSGVIRADAFKIAGIAKDLTAIGIAGVVESGSTEGYITLDSNSDYLLWYMTLPDTYYYGGAAADLSLEFDLSEAAAATGTDSYVLSIYEYGTNTNTIVSENLSMSATARAWVESSGFGNNASISGTNEAFIVKINTSTANDDCNIYGARLKYRVGLDTD